jgi:hypothetical protein
MGAATAALLGLLLSQVDPVETIAKSAEPRNRPAQMLMPLLKGSLIASLLAVPDQGKGALGAVYLVLAFVIAGVALLLVD